MAVQTYNLRTIIDDFVEKHGPVVDALLTTYTCDCDFIEKEIIPALGRQPDGSPLRVHVVCDARNYRGGNHGPWVTVWPGSELFHPKLAWLVTEDATLLVVGSGNLTHSGQNVNQEIIACRTWEKQVCPASIKQLLDRIARPGLVIPAFPVARDDGCHVLGVSATPQLLVRMLPNQRVRHLVIVSPFYDAPRRDNEIAPQDLVWRILKRCSPERIDLVVPVLSDESGDEVPVPRKLISSLAKEFGIRFRLWGVPGLHAKGVFACRDQTSVAIIGSANATSAGYDGGNIEAVIALRPRRTVVNSALRDLFARGRKLDSATVRCRMRPQSAEPVRRWATGSVWDAATETLTISWLSRRPNKLSVHIDGQPVVLDPSGTFAAGLPQPQIWCVVISVPGEKGRQFLPIVANCEAPGPIAAQPEENAPPESWLMAFDPEDNEPDDDIISEIDVGSRTKRRAKRRTKREVAIRGSSMTLVDRCRLLQGFLDSANRVLSENSVTGISDRTRAVAAIITAARHFDPSTACDEEERRWRIWVRAELALFLTRRDLSAPRLRVAAKAAHLLLSGIPAERGEVSRLIQAMQ